MHDGLAAPEATRDAPLRDGRMLVYLTQDEARLERALRIASIVGGVAVFVLGAVLGVVTREPGLSRRSLGR